jgi:hypothetical protein
LSQTITTLHRHFSVSHFNLVLLCGMFIAAKTETSST